MQTARVRLPGRRSSERREFRNSGVDYIATVGFYGDGRIGEIFLNGGKLDSGADIMARDAAIAVSIALQFGAPIKVLADAMTRKADGSPDGPIGTLLQALVQEGYR